MSTYLMKTKKSVAVVIVAFILTLSVISIPASAATTHTLTQSPEWIFYSTTTTRIVYFYPLSVAYNIYITDGTGLVATINVPAYVSGMPGTLTMNVTFKGGYHHCGYITKYTSVDIKIS